MATATAATAERETVEPDAQIVSQVSAVHVPVWPDKRAAYVFSTTLTATAPTSVEPARGNRSELLPHADVHVFTVQPALYAQAYRGLDCVSPTLMT